MRSSIDGWSLSGTNARRSFYFCFDVSTNRVLGSWVCGNVFSPTRGIQTRQSLGAQHLLK